MTFFKDYTEKVWGVSCDQIKPEWGAQRIKGLSIIKTLQHALRKSFGTQQQDVDQKNIETSLIEQFLYPKFGPGQLWERVADLIIQKGGKIIHGQRVAQLAVCDSMIQSVQCIDEHGHQWNYNAEYVISSMPIRDLIQSLGKQVPISVQEVAHGLQYRDFITVGLLLDRLAIQNKSGIATVGDIVPDNWIYIQESDVKIGRLQIFNNWSPYMVADSNKVWLGLEYFCQEGDDLWSMSDEQLKLFASSELEKIGVIHQKDVLDAVVIRVPKAYPAYFGSYDSFGVIRKYLDGILNLYPVGRNGMHRYNNQDHSMLTALAAVESILSNNHDKESIWSVNAEQEYHESKK